MVCHYQSRMFYHLSICRLHILAPFLLPGAWYLGRNHLTCYFDFSPSWRPIIFWKFFYICVRTHTIRSFFLCSFWIQFLSQRFLPLFAQPAKAKIHLPVLSTDTSDQGPETCCHCCFTRLWMKAWGLLHASQILMRVHKASTLRSQAEMDTE